MTPRREAMGFGAQAFIPALAGSLLAVVASGVAGLDAIISGGCVAAMVSVLAYSIARTVDHFRGSS